MAKSYRFTLHKLAALHDGKRVVTVAKTLADAIANVEAIYPGYHIEPIE